MFTRGDLVLRNYGRFLAGHKRCAEANRQLGWILAFVAGSINAGGFLAVQQYTSHVTGMVSSAADSLARGQPGLLAAGALAVLSFLLGAMCCAILVNFARRRSMSSAYALPLLCESALILCFGFLGANLAGDQWHLHQVTVAMLCFIMGMQNAVVTKLSGAVIRTTHMTGIVTDLGIELGRLVYRNLDRTDADRVSADRARIIALGGLLLSFFVGGLCAACAFRYLGYAFTIPVALLLAIISLVPTLDDLE